MVGWLRRVKPDGRACALRPELSVPATCRS